MGKQVGDAEQGVGLVLSDPHGDGLAVLQGDDTVEGQGDGHPLVLLDAAVVVGLEVGHVGGLEEGVGLEVEPGGVGVGDRDADTLGDGLLAHDYEDEVLAAVVEVDLVPGLVLSPVLELLVSELLDEGDAVIDDLALGLVAEERLVLLAVGHGLIEKAGGGGRDDLLFQEELLLHLLTGTFVIFLACHAGAIVPIVFTIA